MIADIFFFLIEVLLFQLSLFFILLCNVFIFLYILLNCLISFVCVQIELAEDKSSLKSARRQLDRSKSDYDHLKEEYNKLEDENAKVKRNYDRIQAEFEEQTQMAEVDGNRWVWNLKEYIDLFQSTGAI